MQEVILPRQTGEGSIPEKVCSAMNTTEPSGYDLCPEIKIDGCCDQAWKGYEGLKYFLDHARGGKDAFIVVAELYPGCYGEVVANGLGDLGFSTCINAEAAVKDNAVLTSLLQDQLTEDRVFGKMDPKQTLKDFFDIERVKALQEQVKACTEGMTLVYGTGASLIAEGDFLVYFDLPRREIENRYTAGMGNFHGDNDQEEYLLKFKRGYFSEWRVADQWKMKLIPRVDVMVASSKESDPAMCTGTAFRKAISQTASQPFRLVPYFAPEVWGGQWMKHVFGLDPCCEKYAWGFDGVPEENSIVFNMEGVLLEFPAIDLVLMEPESLLGEDVFRCFGAEFPIRFDLLDTIHGQNLSLQVHPTASYIAREFGMKYTQDESYYILETEGNESSVYLGIKPGISREILEEALRNSQETGIFDASRYVNQFPVKKHDHVLIPAGTVHCSGAGTMVLEISATPYIFTFKMWDWGRVGWDGRPRPIHIQRALDNIQWERDTEWVKENLLHQDFVIAQGDGWREERTGLHALEFIEARRIVISEKWSHDTEGTVQVLNLVEGREAVVESPRQAFPPLVVHYAETFIIPAAAGEFSIRPYGAGKGSSVTVIKASVRPDEFVFTESDFIQSFLSTIIITLVGTVLSLTVTTVAAYVVSKTELKGIKLITGLFVFTMIFNGGMIPTYLVVNQMHMLDTLWSCMIPNLINTFYLIIMRTFFMDFPKSLEEAARIEGCTDVGILFRIVIPLSRTIIVAIGLFYAVDRWNEFFSGLLYIQDTSKQPLQVLLYRLIKPGGNSMLDMSLRVDKVVLETARMAGVVIAFAPIALLYPFLQKYFTKGIMVGSVKE